MPAASPFERAKAILAKDINFCARYAGAPCMDEAQALRLLQAGDIIVECTPQLPGDVNLYNEVILKGCLHSSIMAEFSGTGLYRIDMTQDRPYCDRCAFFDTMRFDIHLRRFRMVVRSRKVGSDPALRRAVSTSAIRLAGFVDRLGTPVRVRDVRGNMFMRTHDLRNNEKPSTLYCSELAYLAYKENGIDLCSPMAIAELIRDAGGFPDHATAKRMAKFFALEKMHLTLLYTLLMDYERILASLRIEFLRPSNYLLRHVAWPHLLLTNDDFDIVAVVPPEELYLRNYEEMLRQGARTNPY
jgi:hypothetical protein